MSLGDFERLRPDEATAVLAKWSEAHEQSDREAWERVRTLGAVCIQPHVTKSISPKDILRLPWDNDSQGEPSKPQPLSRAEAEARYRSLMEKMKLKQIKTEWRNHR